MSSVSTTGASLVLVEFSKCYEKRCTFERYRENYVERSKGYKAPRITNNRTIRVQNTGEEAEVQGRSIIMLLCVPESCMNCFF